MSDEELPPLRIVISYRRKDTPGGVARLRESLVPHFGRENVFLDIDTLRPGVNWRTTIPETIASANVFLPVIGHHWLDATDDRGRRRLDLPNDVLRFEVATALKAGIPIIPVQLHGARMPDAEELPDDIAELTDFMSIRIEDDDWENDVGKLLRALETVQSEKVENERRLAEEQQRLQEGEARRAAEERQRLLNAEEGRRPEAEYARRTAAEQPAVEKARRRSEPSWFARVVRPWFAGSETAAPPLTDAQSAEPRARHLPSRRTLAILGGTLLVAVVIPLTALLIRELRENARIARYEEKILAKLPAGAEGCDRSSEGEEGAVVTVLCTVRGESVWYLAFGGGADMDAWYSTQYTCTDPFELAHGEACIERDIDLGPGLYWTDERHNIGGQTLFSTSTVAQLRSKLNSFQLTL